jgi:hypothetical protein
LRIKGEDLKIMLLATLLSATPIAFMTFDFMFPNISFPSLNKNLLAEFLLSILVGMPSGYIARRTDVAMMTVISYVALGYTLAVVFYSVPYTVYNLHLVLSQFYYMLFFRITILLLFFFVLGGFIGTILGQVVRDSIRKEETRLDFPEDPKNKPLTQKELESQS